MKKYSILIVGLLLSSGVIAEEQEKERKQDLYLAGSISSQEFMNENGIKYGLHFGAKNTFKNNFFLGGELEIGGISNHGFEKEYNAKQKYSYSANIPIGRRFNCSDQMSIDVYGLVGYSFTRVDAGGADKTYGGIKLGTGVDLSFNNWFLGVRYTRAELDYHNDSSEMIDNNISLLVAYKIKL